MGYKNASYSCSNGKTLFLLFFLVTLSSYYINVGFALKPFMILLFLIFFFQLPYFYIQRLHGYEMVLLLFYLVYCFSGAFSVYNGSSLRIMLGVVLLVVCYFLIKFVIGDVPAESINRNVANAGILFNCISLALYAIGLKSLQFNFVGDRVREFGVMLDRDYPRLIGTLSDPNLFIFYNTIFFTYFLANLKSFKHKVGLALCLATNLLTFSRGGILAMLLVFLLFFFMNNPIRQMKIALGVLVSVFALGYVTIFQMKFDVLAIFEKRIEDFSRDGGSGRFELWGRAWDYFVSNPFLGIGAFNFPQYNNYLYGKELQAHNMFLDILAESGIAGLLLYFLFIVLVLARLWKSRAYKTQPYLFLTFFAFIFQMLSLSLIINEAFFMYLAILSTWLSREEAAEEQSAMEKQAPGKFRAADDLSF